MTRLFAVLISALFLSLPAQAQNSVPEMPDPIRNLANEGAQVRYLGREHGFDAWLTTKGGQEQYFYVPPGGSGFVMGILFDNQGRAVTVEQVKRLQDDGDTLLDSLASMENPDLKDEPSRFAFSSPSERLFYEIENSNWVPLGYSSAPAIYAFIDPQCPHCHALINELGSNGHLDGGDIQVRIVPVGFSDRSKAQAAFLMAAPNPQERFLNHMAGDEDALPVKENINQQGVERNLALMQAWKLDVTPMIIYRGRNGDVKIIRGKPRDIADMLADLPAAG